jgi:hypothetical protein
LIAPRSRAIELLDRAEKTNRRRDATEREAGFGAASDGEANEIVRTAICALECGLATEDWNCVAEAADMLEKMSGYHPWRHKVAS